MVQSTTDISCVHCARCGFVSTDLAHFRCPDCGEVLGETLVAEVVERSWPGLAGRLLRHFIIATGVAGWLLGALILVAGR